MHTEDVNAPRLLVTRPHGLYVNLAARRGNSSPGRTGSTSTLPCTAGTRLSAAAALHRLRRTPHGVVFWVYDYFDYSSRLVNLSRAATTSSVTSRIHLRLVDFSNNRRGSITDRHGFVDTRPRIKLSHLFQ
jgi:hypothetical protein